MLATSSPAGLTQKLVRLEGAPWAGSCLEQRAAGDRLLSGTIGHLTRLGYKLRSATVASMAGLTFSKQNFSFRPARDVCAACPSLDIQLELGTRVLFLIRLAGEENTRTVVVPNTEGAGLGEQDSLCLYRPLIVRHKAEHFHLQHFRQS